MAVWATVPNSAPLAGEAMPLVRPIVPAKTMAGRSTQINFFMVVRLVVAAGFDSPGPALFIPSENIPRVWHRCGHLPHSCGNSSASNPHHPPIDPMKTLAHLLLSVTMIAAPIQQANSAVEPTKKDPSKETAKPALTTVMRNEGDKSKAIAVNLKNILRGVDDDLPLSPGDQLIVPQ